jgi:hypothetical protein
MNDLLLAPYCCSKCHGTLGFRFGPPPNYSSSYFEIVSKCVECGEEYSIRSQVFIHRLGRPLTDLHYLIARTANCDPITRVQHFAQFFGIPVLSKDIYYNFLVQVMDVGYLLFKSVQFPQIAARLQYRWITLCGDGYNALRNQTNLIAVILMWKKFILNFQLTYTGTNEKFSPQFISEGYGSALAIAELNDAGIDCSRIVSDVGFRNSFRHKATSKAGTRTVEQRIKVILDHYPPVEEHPRDLAFQRACRMPTPEQVVSIMQPKFHLYDTIEWGLDAWHYWENFQEGYRNGYKKSFPGKTKGHSKVNMDTRALLEDLISTIGIVYWKAVKFRNAESARALITAFFLHLTSNKHSRDCVYFFKDGKVRCPCADDPQWSAQHSILDPDEVAFLHRYLNDVWIEMPLLSFGAVTSPAESVFDTISNDIPKNREKTFQFGAGFTVNVLDRNENASRPLRWRARNFRPNSNSSDRHYAFESPSTPPTHHYIFEIFRVMIPELRDHVPNSRDEDFVLAFPEDD